MGINSEKHNGQIVKGSPAQIWEESDSLAAAIFGSNFEAYAWATFYDILQSSHSHSHSHMMQ